MTEVPDTRVLNVLIVDDSATMRAMIRRAVQLSGVEVGAVLDAPHGEAGLALLDAHPIDVVFTDINMPVMDGVEMLREIRARGWTRVRTIVVSSDGSAARRTEVERLGVRRVIGKPLAPEEIREALCDGE